MPPPTADFSFRIVFKKGQGDPRSVFDAASELIDGFGQLDEAVAGSVDSKLRQHTDAGGGANFECAVLRGLFVEANFSGANLREANFSHSLFYGADHYETSFFAADLTGAKFNFADIKAARFRKAILTGTDFTSADTYDRVRLPHGQRAIPNAEGQSIFGS